MEWGCLDTTAHWWGSQFVSVKAYHPNASVDRMYLPRRMGGRGLQRVESVWEQETVSAALYVLRSKEPQVQGAVCGLHSADDRRGT